MDLKPYVAPLLKWWWLIVTAALLATGASFLAVREQPIRYQSKATLLIGRPFDNLNPDGNQLWLSQQLAQTYAGFAQREPVRNATMEALGLEWLPVYNAFVPPQTQFIEISVIDTEPLRAQMVANELANQLIQLSPSGEDQETQQRQDFVTGQLDDLQTQIDETEVEIEALQTELGTLFSAREIADTQEQIGALDAKLRSLQINYATLLSNSQQQATNALTILEPAELPVVPVGPNPYFTVLLAGLMGALLAAGAAYLLEYLDDTLSTPEEVERIANLPLLGGISIVKRKEGEISSLIAAEQPRSPTSEALRDLRTGIQFSNLDKPCKTILVTSPNQGDGKSFIASNLAVVLAQAGYKTLIIDADLRLPMQHKIFGLANESGLSNLLLDLKIKNEPGEIPSYKIDDYAYKVPEYGLFILPSGSIPPNPSELLGSAKMKALLSHLPKYFDYIIVDSPPALSVTDAVVLSALTDGVLLVVSAKRTRRMHLKRSIKRLGEVSANIMGIALNKLSTSKDGYYYNYNYGESSAKVSKKVRLKEDQISENGLGADELVKE